MTATKMIVGFFYIVAAIAAVCGIAVMVWAAKVAENGFQEQEGMVIAIAVTVIPYCLARTFGELLYLGD